MKSLKNKKDMQELYLAFKEEIDKRSLYPLTISNCFKLMYWDYFVSWKSAYFCILILHGYNTRIAWDLVNTNSKDTVFFGIKQLGWDFEK